jgi:predicted TIM-barrel fold metal-dependent hydrolase
MPEWRFFDCDVMVGRPVVPPPVFLPDAAALLNEMDYYGIEESLFYTYSFGADARRRQNKKTLEAARQSARLTPCWVLATEPEFVHERLEDHVDEMLDAGVRAARILPDEGPWAGPLRLSLYSLEKVFERLSGRRVPLLIPAEHLHTPQAAATFGFDRIDEICRAFPQLPLVLLNPKYNSQSELIALMRRHKNLHFTISTYGLFRQVESAVKMFGADRLLFGSGMPQLDPSLPVGMINYALLPAKEKALIAGDNLRRLLAAAVKRT